MSDTVIRVENLSKKYVINHQQAGEYTTLRDNLAQGVQSWGRKLLHSLSKKQQFGATKEEFWALKDVSFEVKQGDRLGIIGRNGAGKSTLLKILSRITEPTTGQITIHGRVASLLEVGTGFHLELTGRENIFLNGAILGMSKIEIKKKFDEIVAFAEIEKFIDTPVKRYSSGMYMRLAFAVAAHLETDILIVDEVLAVGDARFQKKCIGKIQSVSNTGRTVFFVSHNMALLRQLCCSTLFLQKGEVLHYGETEKGISLYLASNEKGSSNYLQEIRKGNETNYISIEIKDKYKEFTTCSLIFNDSYFLILKLRSYEPISDVTVVARVYNNMGELVSSVCTLEEGIDPFSVLKQAEIEFFIPKIQLLPGYYSISIFIYKFGESKSYFEAEDVMKFEVHPAIVQEAAWAYRTDHGVVRITDGGSVTYL